MHQPTEPLMPPMLHTEQWHQEQTDKAIQGNYNTLSARASFAFKVLAHNLPTAAQQHSEQRYFNIAYPKNQ